jgi:hypothetical protein
MHMHCVLLLTIVGQMFYSMAERERV